MMNRHRRGGYDLPHGSATTFYECARGGLKMRILLFLLILGCLFGCSEDNDDSIAEDSPAMPTITIEKLRSEKFDGEIVGDLKEVHTDLKKIFVYLDLDDKFFGEMVLWRLHANPAPITDLAVIIAYGTSERSRGSYYVIIPKNKKSSAEFSSLDVDAVVEARRGVNLDPQVTTYHIKIEPLPTVSVVGKGILVDFEKLPRGLPTNSLGNHRIPGDYNFPLYEVGEQSEIFFQALVRRYTLPEIVSIDPPPSSRIRANSIIHVTFNKRPSDVVINPGRPTIASDTLIVVRGPFNLGPLRLSITWSDGSIIFNYTVIP